MIIIYYLKLKKHDNYVNHHFIDLGSTVAGKLIDYAFP